jgi:hypothetical protein
LSKPDHIGDKKAACKKEGLVPLLDAEPVFARDDNLQSPSRPGLCDRLGKTDHQMAKANALAGR